MTHPPALALTDWGLIQARGPDAARFLHSQLTQDIEGLPPGESRLAGWCSAKGRLLASFVVWRSGPDTYWLALSRDLLAATLKRLRMFVLRAKCTLEDASEAVVLLGLAGPQAQAWLGAAAVSVPRIAEVHGGEAVALPASARGGPRWLLALPAGGPLPPGLPGLERAAWDRLELSAGVIRIVQATAEQFVPQMVNLELVGGVNFQKGCYPGQEVVARSQYRGTLKRRLQLFALEGTAAPGDEVFHEADPGQPAGLVALAAPALGGEPALALVELKLAALDGGRIALRAPDGPVLHRLDLPYPVPIDLATDRPADQRA